MAWIIRTVLVNPTRPSGLSGEAWGVSLPTGRGPGAAGPAARGGEAMDLAMFEGTWRFVWLEIEGTRAPRECWRDARMVLRGDEFLLVDGSTHQRGVYTVDPGRTPKAIDVTFTEGPEVGQTSLGIYELVGDLYLICIGLVGRDRPVGFASTPGSGHVLEVLERSPAGRGASRGVRGDGARPS